MRAALMRAVLALVGCVSGLVLAGCTTAAERPVEARASSVDGVATGYSVEGARPVAVIGPFEDPESIVYDPDQDVIFVSNVKGFGSAKDNYGSITRITASRLDDPVEFVSSGVGGVTLHAPKGMALQGDTLWVCDIDVLRGFDRRTGRPVAEIDLRPQGAVQLNDIAAGPDGSLRVTDTRIYMVFEGNIHVGGDRIFAIDRNRVVSVAAAGADLHLPNGIKWDSTGKRWAFVSFDRITGQLATIPAAGGERPTVLRKGSGMLDGLEPLPGGRWMFASWADSSIHVLDNGQDTRVIREVPEPADIGVDTRRGRVLIPLTVLGQVQVWDLGRWWSAAH